MVIEKDEPWEGGAQEKNHSWYLPRPKPDNYKGGMPLHAEDWVLKMAAVVLDKDLQEENVLQPFAGAGKFGVKMDIKEDPGPHVIGDAHNLPFKDNQFEVVLCDPPYSNEEAEEIYDTPELNYSDWTSEAERVLKPGGLLILYHKYVVPNPNGEKFTLTKQVSILSRTWHLPRVARYYKLEE